MVVVVVGPPHHHPIASRRGGRGHWTSVTPHCSGKVAIVRLERMRRRRSHTDDITGDTIAGNGPSSSSSPARRISSTAPFRLLRRDCSIGTHPQRRRRRQKTPAEARMPCGSRNAAPPPPLLPLMLLYGEASKHNTLLAEWFSWYVDSATPRKRARTLAAAIRCSESTG